MDLTAEPLDGIKVLELGQFIAGPGSAMILGDLGADVIKVEPFGGESARHSGQYGRSMIRTYNRDKKSICVDLGRPEGVDIVKRLIADSDVVVQNMRPNKAASLGIGPEQMLAEHPRLVYVSITGLGSAGAGARRPGLDIVAQAESGLMSMIGEPDGLPHRVGIPIIDAATTHVAAQAVLAALFRRERTGIGAQIEMSLLDVAIQLQAAQWSEYFTTGTEPRRIGNGNRNNVPGAELIEVQDGHIVLSAYLDQHWLRLCEVLDRDDLARDERFSTAAARVANRPAVKAELARAFASLTVDESIDALSRNGIVAGAVKGYEQVRRDAESPERRIFVRPDAMPDSEPPVVALPYDIDGAPGNPGHAVPEAGEHTAAVLASAGYSAAEILHLLDQRLVSDIARAQ